jgi:hypothetical protein
MFIDINYSNQKMDRIIIFEGDDVHTVAEEFIKRHNLSKESQGKLR